MINYDKIEIFSKEIDNILQYLITFFVIISLCNFICTNDMQLSHARIVIDSLQGYHVEKHHFTSSSYIILQRCQVQIYQHSYLYSIFK